MLDRMTNKTNSSLHQEYITTLCALCMNDDDNTRLFKQALEQKQQTTNLSAVLQGGTAAASSDGKTGETATSDLDQRIKFLQALLDAV
mmetsp:Transcript_22416/g.41737  ORF Transcript_22416/g.41737 Transcript_22416/m.41737 type:complete len:88 (+) Transcript_22416:320-583(+)